jgi:hypothetical protein
MESVTDERVQLLSGRARVPDCAIRAWVTHLPEGVVHVIRELFPPEDGYGSELIVTLQPSNPRACVLTIGVISDAIDPYHFHLGDVQRIAQTEAATRYWTVPAQVPLFCKRRGEVTQDEIAAICQAVAEASVFLELGVIQGTLLAIETSVLLPAVVRSRRLHGASGPMRLVKLMRRFGGAEVRFFTFAPWI